MNETQPSTAIQTVTHLDEALLTKLRGVPIFASLTDDQLVCLEGASDLHLESGELVLRQGEVARYFWILLEGELSVFHTDAEGHEMSLHVLPTGSAFGEVPLLANIPNGANIRSIDKAHVLRLNEEVFWNLMTTCPEVRKAILGNMAMRLQKMQSLTVHQEKMASLGTLAAGLMHELNNPGTAAKRAASQLRENLLRLQTLSAKFSRSELTAGQKQCMLDLQEQALSAQPKRMNSLEQSDAEEALAEWMENAHIDNAWKLAPTLVAIGIDSEELECAREEFPGEELSDALNWLEALVSSMQLVSTIEESISRVSDLVHAVKSYAYEGKGQRHSFDINESIHATLVILGHKFREKQIVVEKEMAPDLPTLYSEHTGLNQIWTNLLDNSIDALQPQGHIRIRTWVEAEPSDAAGARKNICISITDDGAGIPQVCQKQIFDPFFTTKQVGVGTGLGLGIVYRIVEQFHGRILFSSQPGYTEFVVRLPATAS